MKFTMMYQYLDTSSITSLTTKEFATSTSDVMKYVGSKSTC